MRSNIFQILQWKSLRLSLCAVALTMTTAVSAQDDSDFGDDTAAALKAPKRKTVADKNTTIEVHGVVVDNVSKKPLAGVKMQVLGDHRYAGMTNAEGKFTIKVPTFATALYVEAPRYLSQQVAIRANDANQNIRVVMISNKFAPMYENSTTVSAQGALTSDGHGITIDQQLEQKLGADVHAITRSGQVDGGAAMFIRGLNSLNSNGQPLVILDGVELDMQQSRDVLHAGRSFNMLSTISPSDIDKVTVLKNATALYGARGANGVILIDTKRGHSMATRIDADLSVGVTTIPVLQKTMGAYDYRTYATEMIGTMDQIKNNVTNKKYDFRFLDDDPTRSYYQTYHNNTDWNDFLYRNAMTQNYSINVQGGDDIGMYNLSVGYVDAQNTVKSTDFDRLNVRFNTDIKILWNLVTKFDMSFSRTNNQMLDFAMPADLTTGTITSPLMLGNIKSPLLYPYQYNANINGFSSLLSGADDMFDELGSNFSLANPLAIIQNGEGDNKNKIENTNFNVHIEPKYIFSDRLSLVTSFSYTLNRNSQKYYRPYEGVPSFQIPEVGKVTAKFASAFSKESNVLSNTHLDWNQKFGAHSIDATVGFRYNSFSYDINNLATQYTGSVNDKNPGLSSNEAYYQDILGANDEWTNLQWYVDANYNYMNRYFLNVSLLAEANSRFGANCSGLNAFGTKWAIFPNVQVGWVMSNENWFPKNSGINYLQLHAGYDISGNDDISNYAARTSFSSVKYGYNIIGMALTNLGNDEIKWETTQKFNVGFNLRALNNRLAVNFDYFIHNTNDLLTIQALSNPIAGIKNYWNNGGKLVNEGFEVNVNGKPIAMKDWQLEIGATVGHYDNKLKALPAKSFTDGAKVFTDGTYLSSVYGDNNIITSVGNPVGLFYGYKTNGVFKRTADAQSAGKSHENIDGYTTTNLYVVDGTGAKRDFEAGDIRFVDLNGDGIINELDKTVIGNPNPDIYGNISTKLTWKRLSLGAVFTYSLGNDIYNYQKSVLYSAQNLYNQADEMVNRWRYEGHNTYLPKATYGDPMGNSRFSDRWIEDGSYLRLSSLVLGYQIPIPEAWTSWLQGLSVWAEANNLFTLTRYSGSDPEFSIGNGMLYQGIDAGNLPLSRTFTFGVKINL